MSTFFSTSLLLAQEWHCFAICLSVHLPTTIFLRSVSFAALYGAQHIACKSGKGGERDIYSTSSYFPHVLPTISTARALSRHPHTSTPPISIVRKCKARLNRLSVLPYPVFAYLSQRLLLFFFAPVIFFAPVDTYLLCTYTYTNTDHNCTFPGLPTGNGHAGRR